MDVKHCPIIDFLGAVWIQFQGFVVLRFGVLVALMSVTYLERNVKRFAKTVKRLKAVNYFSQNVP